MFATRSFHRPYCPVFSAQEALKRAYFLQQQAFVRQGYRESTGITGAAKETAVGVPSYNIGNMKKITHRKEVFAKN